MLSDDPAGPDDPGTPDDPAIDAYLDEIWLARGLSVNTLSAYRRDLRALQRGLRKPLLAGHRA